MLGTLLPGSGTRTTMGPVCSQLGPPLIPGVFLCNPGVCRHLPIGFGEAVLLQACSLPSGAALGPPRAASVVDS